MWKSQLRYFPCHSIADGQCTCGKENCGSPGKHPCSTGWQRQATNDPAQVEQWRNDPKINLAIACGRASNIFVLDVDGIYGPISVAQLEKENEPLPKTYTVRTGNGSQLYFQYPKTPLPNSVKFVVDLDTRSEGGYVIAAGARHKSGRTYAVTKDVEPAVMPEWLIQKILTAKPLRLGNGVVVPKGGLQRGSRNDTIFKLAASLHHKNFSIEAATAACVTENENAETPLSQQEVITAVKSAYGYPTADDPAGVDLFADQPLRDLFVDSDPGLKYVVDSERWMSYRNGVWSVDHSEVQQIGDFLRSIEPAIPDPKIAAATHRRLNSQKAANAVLFFCKGHNRLSIGSQQFDPDPWVLGLPGGELLDLRSGEIRPAAREDLITMVMPVRPAPEGEVCERWVRFHEEAHGGDPETITFIQQWFGLCLTASKNFDILLFLIGKGGAGKGTTLQPLQKLLGPYATTVSATALLDKTDPARRDNYLADLCGKRLAVSAESSKMQRIDAQNLKWLTGGDAIQARRLREQPITFAPTHKLVISSNFDPVLELDDGLRRRVVVIPFENVPANPEPGLREWFCEPEQLSLIFRWALDGLASLRKAGELKKPSRGSKRTEEYFESQDLMGRFGKDHLEFDPAYFESTQKLFNRWTLHCNREGEPLRVGSLRTFLADLTARYPSLKEDRRLISKERVRGLWGVRLSTFNESEGFDGRAA